MLVRTDIPLGVAAAMIVHAAGESAAFNPPTPGTFAVVLGVDSAAALEAVDAQLAQHGVSRIMIREPDPPWNGQPMSIGVTPIARENVRGVLRHLRLYQGQKP